jgi:hypothetical protein
LLLKNLSYYFVSLSCHFSALMNLMKKIFLLLNLSILCLFSSFSWSAGTEVEADQQKLGSELNFPDYSPLGQRIANGESVKGKVFYWIKADGTIGSTKRGWSRVPKSSRHLVYLDRNKAEQAVQDSSKSPEERVQIEKQRRKEETRFIEEAKDFSEPQEYPSYRFKGNKNWNCVAENIPKNGFGSCKGQYEVKGSGGYSTDYIRFTGDSYVGEFWNQSHNPSNPYGGKYHGQGTSTWADGSNYVGEWKNNKRDGQGTYTWTSGSKYVGDWRMGQRYGNGTYIWASGHKYVGQWRNGDRHGHGTITYTDGTIEEGFWSLDHHTALAGPVCPGSYSAFSWHNCIGWRPIDSRNDHIGWYQNGQAHGEGISLRNQGKKNGSYYSGNFKNGEAHGQGMYVYAGGDEYSGESKDNKRHGQGTYTYADGRKYVGEYKNGNIHGQGTYTWGKGNKYIGEWKDGKSHGQGTETYADGRKYVGEFKDGPILQGTLTWANEQKYIGEFKDYKSHGVGNFYRTDGSIMGGLWKNDEPVEGYSGYKCSGDSALWSDCIGTLTLADGTQFVGKFLDGKTSGKGSLIFSDNRPMQFAFEPTEQELVVSNYKGPVIGDIVKTEYFEVTVNSASFQAWVGDGNFPVYPGPGNKFLVIHVTYVNSDNEARVLMGGEVVVRVDDKEFLFDAPEVVFAEGYIAFDSLNPMVTRKGNVVFKVSEGLKGEIFYKPARSSELIYLN